MILAYRKTESTNITKATKKSSENNSIAYFRIAWECLLFLFFVLFVFFMNNDLGILFSGNGLSGQGLFFNQDHCLYSNAFFAAFKAEFFGSGGFDVDAVDIDL